MKVSELTELLAGMSGTDDVVIYCDHETDHDLNPHEVIGFTIPKGGEEIRLHIDYLL